MEKARQENGEGKMEKARQEPWRQGSGGVISRKFKGTNLISK